MNVNGLKVYPYYLDFELLKLKANCLTRLGKYEEASNIMYALWHLCEGFKLNDTDTLSMLAAQYKRRAICKKGNWQIKAKNWHLIF